MQIRLAATLALVGAAAAATAQPVFFATGNNTLYRFTLNGSVDTFQLNDKMMSLALDPNGDIVGHSAEINGGQGRESYRLDDPFGTPSLTMLSDQVAGPRATLTFVASQGYAVDEDGMLNTVDGATLVDTGVVGDLGLPTDSNGSGYDPATDTFYLINGTTDSLYSVDYTDASNTLIGSLGIDYLFGGAEFFDGTLYAWVQDTGRQQLVLGSVDTTTGAFTALRAVDSYDPNENIFMGLAVVPAPATVGLLAAGALAAVRRRR
jgi:hypothetical protein